MHGDEDGLDPGLPALLEQRIDRRVEGLVIGGDAEVALRLLAGRHWRRISVRSETTGNEVDGVMVAVGVDHQPADGRMHQRRIEQVGQLQRHGQRPRIPGDMHQPLVRPQPQVAMAFGNAVRGVVAHQHERATPPRH